MACLPVQEYLEYSCPVFLLAIRRALTVSQSLGLRSHYHLISIDSYSNSTLIPSPFSRWSFSVSISISTCKSPSSKRRYILQAAFPRLVSVPLFMPSATSFILFPCAVANVFSYSVIHLIILNPASSTLPLVLLPSPMVAITPVVVGGSEGG